MGLVIKSPLDCSPTELKLFIRLAREGGQVEGQRLPARVQRAKALVFLSENRNTIGIAALKQPYDSYRADVFAQAKATVAPESFIYEVGWVFVVEQHQGRKLSRLLVEAALSKAESRDVFATSAIGRKAMHRTLNRLGFVKHGQPYPPSQGNEDLLLFVRSDAPLSVAGDAHKAARA